MLTAKSIGTTGKIDPANPDFEPPSPGPLQAAARQFNAQKSNCVNEGVAKIGRIEEKRNLLLSTIYVQGIFFALPGALLFFLIQDYAAPQE